MVEFKKKIDTDEYYLVINNEEIKGVDIEASSFLTSSFNLNISSREIGEYVITLLEENNELSKSNLLTINNWGNLNTAEVNLVCFTRNQECEFRIFYNLVKWFHSFSFEDYYIEFSRIFGIEIFAVNKTDFTEHQDIFELRLSFDIWDREGSLLDEILESYKLITKFHQEAINRLTTSISQKMLTVFDFPKDSKTACEQYLLYFAQFLQDLGINATSNLKEEAGKVLFSVTPTDDKEALDKIREALAVYLNLPSSPIVYDESFAAMRLQQQIENLQHAQKMAVRELQFTEKLLVAQFGTIQEKNIIISQKDSVIEQQNKVIEKITSKSIMMDSLENKEEFEKIFDGLEVGESKDLNEKLGIKFNPITSIKTFGKKLAGKDNEITSLNLEQPEPDKTKLEKILENVSEDNIHEETDWGESVGKEIIE